jgi:hypothetical protein
MQIYIPYLGLANRKANGFHFEAKWMERTAAITSAFRVALTGHVDLKQ